VRWGVAAGGIYYYNTTPVFAEQENAAIDRLDQSLHHIQESTLPTVDAIVEEKRHRQAERQAHEAERAQAFQATSASEEHSVGDHTEGVPGGEESLGGLEDEADQQGAFNPETGEINWDCPCLGGMAHGPCGEEFRAAFSCFVYSKEEPKGMECIDKFKGMQDCFRQHPEMYGSELEDDEEELEEELRAQEVAKTSEKPLTPEVSAEPSKLPPEGSKPVKRESVQENTKLSVGELNGGDEGGNLVPKEVHDARSRESS